MELLSTTKLLLMKLHRLFLGLILLLSLNSFSQDTLKLHLGSGFNQDTVSVFLKSVNEQGRKCDTLLYQSVITTNSVVGLAESLNSTFTKGENSSLVIVCGRSSTCFVFHDLPNKSSLLVDVVPIEYGRKEFILNLLIERDFTFY